MKVGEVTPENPVLKLELYSKTKFEYTERVLMQRTIQDYKLRPGFVALGLGGAAMAFYLANSNAINGSGTSPQSLTLNGAGVLIAFSGFLNLKPVGEPRPTGEERYLRITGNIVKTDTVKADSKETNPASIIAKHNDRIIFEEVQSFTNGSIEVTLPNKLNELQLTGTDPGSISIDVSFEDSVYSFDYRVEDILQPYAEITSQLTGLRNSPEESPDNVLADLVKGSQLLVQNAESEDWYQVLYGISENYIQKEDAKLIWRSSDFIEQEQVVTVPRIPFGNIDVESNIPILRGQRPNAAALIITNQDYSDLPERNYAYRDGRLIKAYLEDALGYSEKNIFELSDVKNEEEVLATLSKIEEISNDSTELFAYLSGHGSVNVTGDQPLLQLEGIAEDEQSSPTISLQKFFKRLSDISSGNILVLGDIDFSNDVSAAEFSPVESRQIIEANAAPLISKNPQASLLMGTGLMNPSSLYVSSEGEDKKHHVFPYYFAKALQERRTSLSDIYQYLERNISYTARRLYDRPQDPVLIGNTSLDLATQ